MLRTIRYLADLLKSVYWVSGTINNQSPNLLNGYWKILDKYSGGEGDEIY